MPTVSISTDLRPKTLQLQSVLNDIYAHLTVGKDQFGDLIHWELNIARVNAQVKKR